jgi:hypothetical protein
VSPYGGGYYKLMECQVCAGWGKWHSDTGRPCTQDEEQCALPVTRCAYCHGTGRTKTR